MCKNTALKQCLDLYIYVGKSMYEFKLIRPVYCPSVLLTLKGQRDKFLNTHSWAFLFVRYCIGSVVFVISLFI